MVKPLRARSPLHILTLPRLILIVLILLYFIYFGLYATESMRWDREGFDVVCASTKNMIRELEKHVPMVQGLIDAGDLRLEEYATVGFDYEVIP